MGGMQAMGASQPWPQARSSELAHLLGKCFLFASEFQLVKFYSSRKLVTSLRSYKGLGCTHPVKPSGPWESAQRQAQALLPAHRPEDTEAPG